MEFICYAKCSTCQKAQKWLDAHDIAYTVRPIKEEHPSPAELKEWHKKSGLPIKRFVNTSGMLYRELGLKDRIPAMSEAEIYKFLGQDGMLVKRPLLITEDHVLAGFKEAEWKEALGIEE